MGEVQHPISHPIQPFTPSAPAQPAPAPVIRQTQNIPAPTAPEIRETPPVRIPATPAIQETERTPFPRTPETPPPTTTVTLPPTTPAITQPQTTEPTPVQTTPVATLTPSPTPTAVIVTVTVPVFPYGSVYNPYYYYPPGYVYPINSYYPSGSLTVTSYPPNAIVTIDGYNQETTPWVFTNLLPGYHTVEVNYPGYEAYVTNIYLNDGESQEVDANLLNLGNYGSMFVASTPSGADVYVDGNYEGVSPVTVGALTEGPTSLNYIFRGMTPRRGQSTLQQDRERMSTSQCLPIRRLQRTVPLISP